MSLKKLSGVILSVVMFFSSINVTVAQEGTVEPQAQQNNEEQTTELAVEETTYLEYTEQTGEDVGSEKAEEVSEKAEQVTEQAIENITANGENARASNADIIASGDCGANGDNVKYELYGDGLLRIYGSGDMENYGYGSAPWYSNISSITSVVIENGITSIGDYAFDRCRSITSINIPSSVTSIGDYAFEICVRLSSINIPSSVTSIGKYAFYYAGLTSIIIPNSVTSIEWAAFSNCSKLTSITIPNSVKSIGYFAFRECTRLTSINIPSSVKSIGNYAFYNCTGLTSISIPSSVKSIGEYAFCSCINLTGITIEDGVTSIGACMFNGCSSITNVNIPSSVKSIGYHAFESCTSLTNVTIENGVTTIEAGTFYNCTSLTNITIPSSIISIEGSVFSNCTSLTSINVDGNNSVYCSIDGILFKKDKAEICKYPEDKANNTYTIPDSVTSIGESAFWHCSNLNSISIPSSVTSIGNGAFRYCSNLTSITIPSSVTRIENYAFNGCSGLKDVFYTGSEDEWNKISIGSSNTLLTNATIHFNCLPEGTITLSNDRIVINGRGNAILRFYLKDSNNNVLSNKQVKYTIGNYSGTYTGTTDEAGLLEIKTPELTSTTELKITITALDGTGILDNVKTANITVKPLSYFQQWTGQVGASLEGKIGAGVGAEIGPASAEAQIASASIKGGLSRSLSIKNEYDAGQRNLTITSTIGGSADGKAEAGLFANASYKNTAKNPTVKVDLASISANAKGGEDITKSLEIKNYDAQDTSNLLKVGYFLLDSTLDSSSNALSKVMLDVIGMAVGESYNAEEKVFTLVADAGADIGKAEIFDNGVTLFTLGGETTWKSTYGTDSEGNNEYGSSLGTSADFSIGSLTTSMGDGGKGVADTGTSVAIGSVSFINSEIESKIKSNNGDITKFDLTALEKENGENVFLWSGTESYEKNISYEGSEAKTAVASDSTMSNLATGKEGFINPTSFANAVNNVLNSGAAAEYSRNYKYTQGMDFPISFGLQALAGLTVGVDVSGVETEKFELENGILINGVLYKQAESTAISDMEASKQTLNNVLAEPMEYVGEQIKGMFDSVAGKVGEIIQQGQATIESVKNNVAEGFKNCQVSISKFMGGASTYSIAVLAIDDDTAEADTSSVAFTVGETYIVGLTDEEGNEITDFSENPLKITLSYTEEELAAAGLNNAEDELQNLKIYRYDSDKKVYACAGGALDYANSCVSAEIIYPGQYILANDGCAPSVTQFTASNYTARPTFSANVADVSGLSDFSFKIDDKEYVNYDNLYDYYSVSNAWFEYLLNEDLADGEHTASITAVDSAGNAMVNAITIDFIVDTTKPVFESLDVNTDSDNIIVSANVRDSNLSGVTAYVTALGTTYTYDLQNTAEALWENQIEVPNGVTEVKILVKAYDTAGNCAEGEMQLLDLEKYVLGDADDNGIISNADAACILKKAIDSNYIMPVENTHTNYIKVVDMDGNGVVDLLDAISILKSIENKE